MLLSDVVVRGLEREDVSEAWKGLSPRQVGSANNIRL